MPTRVPLERSVETGTFFTYQLIKFIEVKTHPHLPDHPHPTSWLKVVREVRVRRRIK
jgi:hypothetical protein